MRFIPTKVHGLLDYIMGIFLALSPWLLGFNENSAARWTAVLLGAGMILYSLLTDYEWGVSRSLSMKTHLAIDLVAGVFLAVSPWLLGFADYVYLPHLILGILEIGAALMTRTVPGSSMGKLGHTSA